MANGTKEYKIVINGLTESIDAVKSLNEQLNNLETKIKAIESNTINIKTNVSTSTSASGGASTSSLSEEEKLQKQINQLEEKQVAYSKEIYQNYLDAKDVLKETVKNQQQLAAAERVQANTYSNTMEGIKQKLADLKSVHFTTDISTDEFKKQTEEINELTNKLKKLEEEYGVFTRNVGNYSSAFDGLKKVTVEVGAISREFNSMREATRTLKAELFALENAEKGNTKQADNLRAAINRLESAMNDARTSSRAMDEAMDFMQSFTAMASVGNGLKAFFGFDDNEITKSIQKLVALQGVLNGLEKIRRQMDSREGIGKILGRGFDKIDTYTYGLRRLNVQLRGTGTSAKIAAAGIKVLNYALKGLMTAGLLVAIDLAIEGFQKLVGAVKDLAKGDADLVNASEVAQNAIDAQNRVLEKNIELIKKANEGNLITDDQARIMYEQEYARALKETSRNIDILIRGLKELYGIEMNQTGLQNLLGGKGDKGVTWIGGFKDAIKTFDDFNKRFDELEIRVSHNESLKSWVSTVDDAKDEFAHLTKAVGMDFVAAMNKFNDGTREGTRALIEYINKMDELTGGRYSKAMQLVKVDNEGLQKDLETAWAMIQNLRDNVFKNPIVVRIELNAKIEQELDRLDPTRAMQRNIDQWTQMLVLGVDDAGNKLTEAQRKNIEKIVAENKKALAKQQKQKLDSERSAGKKLAQEAERVEKEINQLRIENMKDGLEKTIAQLNEERRQRIQQAEITGIRVGELTVEINKLYDKKVEDAKREHAKEVQRIYEELWDNIYRSYDSTFRMNMDTQLIGLETRLQRLKDDLTKVVDYDENGKKNQRQPILSSRYASYGGTQLPNNMDDELRRGLGHHMQAKSQSLADKNTIKYAKEYLDLLEEIEKYEIYSTKYGDDKETYEQNLKDAENALNEWLKENKTTAEEMDNMIVVQELKQEGYTKSLVDAYKIRIREASAYFNRVYMLEKEHSFKVMKNEEELLYNESNTAKREEKKRFEEEQARLEEAREKGLITDEKYKELSERQYEEYANALKAIDMRYVAESERIQQDHMNRLKQITAEGLRGMLNEYRDAFSQISNLQSRQPQLMSGILGDMGIINIGKTRSKYKEAIDSYKELSNNIIAEKKKLQEKLDSNQITFDDFQQAKRELDGLEQDCADAAMDVSNSLKNLTGEALGQINQYVQTALQSFQTIMQAFQDFEDYEFDKQQEAIDKENEILQEKLDKQADILSDHKSKVDSIEDELATSRGDRRQHLIDQLNAEMEAERAAAKEKQRLEKEEQKLKEKQDALDKKRKQAEYKRNLLSILVSTAMATANGLATQPFVPVGIAMGALATSLGMVQYALAAKSKPYAKGGQLEGGTVVGNRHRDGGVKVLGGRAEIEGGEYITNRISTQMNAPLLEFINSKKKKIDVSDLLEFYASSGSVKKSISKVRTKFEDGGYIPTLPTSLDIRDQLQNIVINQDNRPIYVSVVDINNKQEQVRQVQTLAGL